VKLCTCCILMRLGKLGTPMARLRGATIHRCPHSHTMSYHTIPFHVIPYHTIPYHVIPYHHSKPVTGCLGSFLQNMKIISAGCNTGSLGSIFCGQVLQIFTVILSSNCNNTLTHSHLKHTIAHGMCMNASSSESQGIKKYPNVLFL